MTGDESPAGPPGKPVEPAALRASHEDRDGVVEQLRVAAGDGRLTADELDERLERALSARTYGELAVLTADLPAAAGSGPLDWPLAGPGSALEPAPEPRELVRIECGSGDVKRNGAWTVPQRMDITVTSGSVRLDFTKAVITGRTLRIDADVHSGHLQLVTRPGIVIEADDVAIKSGHVHAPAAWAPGVPEILRVEIAGRVRSGSISARPPRRSLWQWLRRAPRPYAEALLR